MRPLTLTVSAFGPYADKKVIDLDSLGTQGIYLITGNTGAGKTSIFDAISYASYGKTSGDDRETDELRSQYAKAGTPTFVELTFLYQGHKYTICRNPKYERPSKRGDKSTTEDKSVELTLEDGNKLTKDKEVKDAIKDIIGLTRAEFAQVAMIAQGDFRKVLHAETKERNAIFSKLFDTEKFKKLTTELKDDTEELTKTYNKLNENVENLIVDIVFDETEANDTSLTDEYEKAKCSEESIILFLDKIIEVQNKKTNELKEKKDQLKARQITLTEDKTKEESRLQQVKQREEKEKELNELLPKLQNISEEVQALTDAEPEQKSKEKKIDEIERQLPQYKELEKQEKS